MKRYDFYQLDVFTDERFQGNPLAVFPAASGFSEMEMQRVANEMNLSETVFVFPTEKAVRRLRIFTPQQELPLAGHPVVGTWNLLAGLGITPSVENGSVIIKQELNIGVLPVEIEFRDSVPVHVTMTQDSFLPGKIVSARGEMARLAEGLGLGIEDLNQTETQPVQVISTGINALAVPLGSLDALRRCRINSSLLSECYLKYHAVGVYAWTFETFDPESKVHARFFAPADNIPEDPATGSAAGSLSGYLIHHGLIDTQNLTIEQGDFMNRKSRIFAEVSGAKGNVSKVRIGGKSVTVAKGEIYLD